MDLIQCTPTSVSYFPHHFVATSEGLIIKAHQVMYHKHDKSSQQSSMCYFAQNKLHGVTEDGLSDRYHDPLGWRDVEGASLRECRNSLSHAFLSQLHPTQLNNGLLLLWLCNTTTMSQSSSLLVEGAVNFPFNYADQCQAAAVEVLKLLSNLFPAASLKNATDRAGNTDNKGSIGCVRLLRYFPRV